jgi:hypothetical protein
MSPQNDTPKLDFTSIPFPTDQLTIGDMRKEDPDLFHGGYDSLSAPASHINALATCHIEHKLACRAYVKALGQSDPYPLHPRQDDVDALVDSYRKYGLSRGKNESLQLIERIESAARSQASQHIKGRTSP